MSNLRDTRQGAIPECAAKAENGCFQHCSEPRLFTVKTMRLATTSTGACDRNITIASEQLESLINRPLAAILQHRLGERAHFGGGRWTGRFLPSSAHPAILKACNTHMHKIAPQNVLASCPKLY